MPREVRDARLTERSAVLEQHMGLVFRGTVTTYTDITHFKISALPEYGDPADFRNAMFKEYYIHVLWDAGGAGAAPQGESQLISAYTSTDGTITHAAFTVPLAVGDEVLLIHPRIENYDIKGASFATATDSLHATAVELDEILDLTRVYAAIACSAVETNLFIDDAPVRGTVGRSVKIDLSALAAGDTYVLREYYRLTNAGAYFKISNDAANTFVGVQDPVLKSIELEPYLYGCKITTQKTAGTDRTINYESFVEA